MMCDYVSKEFNKWWEKHYNRFDPPLNEVIRDIAFEAFEKGYKIAENEEWERIRDE